MEMYNQYFPSAKRATLISVTNLLNRLGFFVGVLVLGYYAELVGVIAVYTLIASVCFIVPVLYAVWIHRNWTYSSPSFPYICSTLYSPKNLYPCEPVDCLSNSISNPLSLDNSTRLLRPTCPSRFIRNDNGAFVITRCIKTRESFIPGYQILLLCHPAPPMLLVFYGGNQWLLGVPNLPVDYA